MNNDLISRSELKKAFDKWWGCDDIPTNVVEDTIDNAKTVDVKFELKIENGITYPKALEHMTFTHTLSIEERQNIIEAYMLGANSNIRPKGEWIKWNFKTFGAMGDWEYKCSNCEKVYGGEHNYCPNCGADMCKGADNEV